jgi:hypothetical protein
MMLVSALLATCGGFLLAVLWMDLMFDVQVLAHRHRGAELPEDVLASIAAYYRRVTTTASPMGHLVGAVMVTTLVATVVQLLAGPRAVGLASLTLSGGPILLALLRVFANAARLGARSDPPARQSAMARSICRDHLLCFAGILAFVALQLWTVRA